MSDEKTSEARGDAEAVYYAALGLLDELTPEQQASVVSNWVKYICAKRAIEMTPDAHRSIYPAFEVLCNDFAKIVQELPGKFASRLGKPCGMCPACITESLLNQLTVKKVVLQ